MHMLSASQLVAEYETYKQSRSRSRGMATSNWVTTLAHDCEAYGVYNRIVPPEQRRETEAGLAMIFAEGADQGLRVKRDLLDLGYEVLGDEGQMVWRSFQISGRKDFALRRNGSRAIRVEVKSCSPWVFERLNTVADLRGHKSPWIRRWDRQVCAYMVLQGVEDYWLMLKDKSRGTLKIIEYTLGDEELRLAEGMIAKAERINRLVQIDGEPPLETKIVDPDICTECEFLHVCNPPLDFGPGARVLDEALAAELAEMADRRAELHPAAKSYEEVDEELKHWIKRVAGESDRVVFGSWVATLKSVQGKNGQQTRISFIKVAQ